MIEYDNVTVSLADSLIRARYETYSEKKYNWDPSYYVSFRGSDRKCFTINAPITENDTLWKLEIDIKNTIFPDGKRSQSNRTRTYLHYPGQIFTAYNTLKYIFASNHTYDYYMEFQIRNIDVITRRNKNRETCVEEWKN